MHVGFKSVLLFHRQSIVKLSSCLSVQNYRSGNFKMATNGAKATEHKERTDEQIVNVETVVAADNKGIDYDKLISKY